MEADECLAWGPRRPYSSGILVDPEDAHQAVQYSTVQYALSSSRVVGHPVRGPAHACASRRRCRGAGPLPSSSSSSSSTVASTSVMLVRTGAKSLFSPNYAVGRCHFRVYLELEVRRHDQLLQREAAREPTGSAGTAERGPAECPPRRRPANEMLHVVQVRVAGGGRSRGTRRTWS